MQFTTPTPARLYQYTDKDAPRFDGAANCLILILKACLVTGYGDKQSAGWQVVEDNQDPVVQKTFVSPTQAGSLGVAVELKVSNDTGQQAKIQLMQSDTVRAECATAFMYKLGSTSLHTEKWCVIASDYGVWFFAEQANKSNIPQAQSGVYLYAGFTQSTTTGIRGLYIKHTGGIGALAMTTAIALQTTKTRRVKLWASCICQALTAPTASTPARSSQAHSLCRMRRCYRPWCWRSKTACLVCPSLAHQPTPPLIKQSQAAICVTAPLCTPLPIMSMSRLIDGRCNSNAYL